MSESLMLERRFFGLHRILLILVLPPIGYYIYVQLRDGWDTLQHHQWSLNPVYFLLSMIAAFGYYLFVSWIWQRVLLCMGSELGFWKSFRVVQLAQLGKYLPGRIWAIGGQFYLGEREGIPRRTMFQALALHWFFNLLSGAVIFLPLVYAFAPLWVTVSLTLFVLFLLTLALCPRHVWRFLSSLVTLGDFEKSPSDLPWLSLRQSLAIFFGFTCAWALFGFAFWAMINAVTEVPLGAYYDSLASFCGAWIIGIFSFFAPAGIGVREGALVYLLGQFLVPSIAVIISIAARLWLTLVEVICAAVAWFL